MQTNPNDGAAPDRVRVDQRRKLPILPVLIGLAIFIGLAVWFGMQHNRKARVADAGIMAPSSMSDLPASKADPAAGPTPESQAVTQGVGVQGGPGSGEGMKERE